MIELIAGATMSSPHANPPPLTPLEVCIGETLASALDLTLIGARPGEIFVHALHEWAKADLLRNPSLRVL